MSFLIIALLASAVNAAPTTDPAFAAAAEGPHVMLKNAADRNVMMPWIGLGTGGYNSDPKVGYNGYPECWDEDSGCGDFVEKAVLDWFSVGGRRLDCANSYHNQKAVGRAMKASKVPRKDMFILSKTGPSYPLGYNDTLQQFEGIKRDLQTDYVDLLLIHWPFQNPSQGNVSHNATTSSDPACQFGATYDATKCRLNTWRAMLKIWKQGGARAVGVSNYNHTHLMEIKDAGLELPSLTQNPFHIYRSSTQRPTLTLCRELDIMFLGYSPLGVPDWHTFPNAGKYNGSVMYPHQFKDPSVLQVADDLGVSPATALLAWQWQAGIPINPRTQNKAHMIENLAAYKTKLSETQELTLWNLPQAWCSVDKHFYECAPDKPTTNKIA